MTSYYQYFHYSGNRDGYSSVAEDMEAALKVAGWEVDTLSPIAVVHALPERRLIEDYKKKAQYVIAYTMLESTRIPEYWVPILNDFDEVWVPSTWAKEMFIKNGITKPIYVVPHGLDPELWKYSKREPAKPFKFFHYNAFYTNRKGWDTLLSAFAEEFKGDPNVELHYKTVFDAIPPQVTQTPNVHVHIDRIARNEIPEYLKPYHCLVMPHVGEAFLLPGIEAMAVGMPVIITKYAGPMEYYDERFYYGVETKGVQIADNHPFLQGGLGEYAMVDKDDLKKQMRHVYENYKEAEQKALLGSAYIHAKYNNKMVASIVTDRFKDAAVTLAMGPSRKRADELTAGTYTPPKPIADGDQVVYAINAGGLGSWVYKRVAIEKGFTIVDLTNHPIQP